MSDSHNSASSGGGEQYRHYPPGVVFHAPHCVDAGDAMSLPVKGAFELYPSHRFDTCFTPLIPAHLADDPDKLVGLMPSVIVEKVDYRQHPYRALPARSPGAATNRCHPPTVPCLPRHTPRPSMNGVLRLDRTAPRPEASSHPSGGTPHWHVHADHRERRTDNDLTPKLGDPHRRRTGAVAQLARQLAAHDPFTSQPDLRLLGAAALFVRLTLADTGNQATIGWALYTYRSTRMLPSADTRAGLAARSLVELARQRGRRRLAIRLRPTAVTGADADSRRLAMLDARLAATDLLHGCGLCDAALHEATAALAAWAPHPASHSGAAALHLIDVLKLFDLCGQVDEAQSLLNTYAGTLAPPDAARHETLAGYATAVLGDARAIRRHTGVCSRRHSPTGSPALTRRSLLAVRHAVLDRLADDPDGTRPLGDAAGITTAPAHLAGAGHVRG